MSADLSQETEIKITLASAKDYQRLCQAWDPVHEVLVQHNQFFTSASLLAAKLAVRLRAENDLHWLTVKGPSQAVGLAKQRLELEVRLRPEQVPRIIADPQVLLALDNPVSALLRERGVDDQLQPWVAFDNLRQRYLRTLIGQRWLVELDRSEFAGGRVDFELELEFNAPTAELVQAVYSALSQSLQDLGLGYSPGAQSKLARALSAQRGT